MAKERISFFERLTGSVRVTTNLSEEKSGKNGRIDSRDEDSDGLPSADNVWSSEIEDTEAELTVDVFQTPEMIVVKAMIAGVRPEDLDINISRDMVTIKGKREEERLAREEDYFVKELYWGSFSRTVTLPEEIDVDESEAVEKHGLLILRLPKLDKKKQSKLKVRTI